MAIFHTASHLPAENRLVKIAAAVVFRAENENSLDHFICTASSWTRKPLEQK
jgi:hypothetical protein